MAPSNESVGDGGPGVPGSTEFAAAQRAICAAIVESSDDAIVGKNLDGVILTWNNAATRLFGYEPAEVIGNPITVIIPATLHREEEEILAKLRRGERIEHFETTRVTKDGHYVEVSLTVSPIRNAEGEIIGASKTARDITARKRADRSRAQLAAIVEYSDDAIASISLAGVIQSWNAAAERIFGYRPDEVIDRPSAMLIPAERAGEELEIIEQVRSGIRVENFETVRIAKNGRRVPIALTVSPVCDAGGVIIGASKIARDISERKLLERAVLEATNREQQQLGQDMHDGLAQELTGVSLMLAAMIASKFKLSRLCKTQLQSIAKLIVHAVVTCRAIAHGLSPLQFTANGLPGALQELADLQRETYGIAATFEAAMDAPIVIPMSFQDHLYRIAQEAVTNARRIPRGKSISILMYVRRDGVRLEIKDGGIGMRPEAQTGAGMGMRIMRFRAAMIGAHFSVERGSAAEPPSFVIARRRRKSRSLPEYSMPRLGSGALP